MATQSVDAKFTHHGSDGRGCVELWTQRVDGRASDEIIVALADLAQRPDLLARMPDAMRGRLLADAGEL